MLLTIKFGGTSVGDAKRIRQAAGLAAKVKAAGHRVVVVTSAMSGVTNRLVALAERIASGGADEETRIPQCLHFTRELEQDHFKAAQKAIGNPKLLEILAGTLYAERYGLERVLFGSHLLGELSPIGYDYLVSGGERLCVPILANCLRDMGVDAVGLGGDDSGIVTDNNYGCAAPRMEQTRQQVRQTLLPLLDSGKLPVVAGFYGRSDQGRVAILGRGGSDYSASLVGCALDADEIWIMTDVDGIKTADPRLVPAAYTLPEMSYLLAAEMALLGAKVLHPKSVLPAARQGIPLRIASSFDPDKPGTRLAPTTGDTGPSVTALTLVRNGALVRAVACEFGSDGISTNALADDLRKQNVDILASASGFNGGSLLWLVGALDAARFIKVLEHHQSDRFKCEIRRDVAVVGVVGDRVATAAGILARVARCLEQAKATPLAILQGATPNSLIIALPDAGDKPLSDTMTRLHTELGLDVRTYADDGARL